MDLKQLRALLAIAQTGSVTRASSLLNIVQPAVTRQLRLLEEDLATPMFERGRHGMELTDAGKAMVEYANRILNEVARARADIRPINGIAGGLVTIGLLPSTCDYLSRALVRSVGNKYPGIRVRISVGYSGELRNWLQTGEVHAALLYDQKPTPALQVQALIEERLWVIGPPGAKLRASNPVSLARLVGQPLVLPSPPHFVRALVDQAATARNIELTVAAETNEISVQKSLVLGQHGWTILPSIAVADELASGTLTAAPLSDPLVLRNIVLAVPTGSQATTPVRCVVPLLLDCMKLAIRRKQWPAARWIGD